MTDVMQDLLIDFDEMGFAPTTACPNPDKYACEWKEKLVSEINCLQEQLEAAANGQETLQKALADKDREVAELNSDLKLLKNNYDCLKTNFDETIEKNKRLRDKVVGLTAEKEQLIKTFGECQAEATKALVEKDKEIKRLKNNVFCSVVIDEGKMRNIINEKVAEFELDIELIKAEAIKECIEKTQAFLAIKCRGVVEDNPNLDEILWGYRKEDVDEFFDNLVKEMAGEG